jgi:hypothetical protein
MPKKAIKPIGKHKLLEKARFNFDVSGETVIGLHNTIVFMLSHVDQFVAEGNDCHHCIKAVQAFRTYLGKILEYSDAYVVQSKKLN